MKKFGGEKFYLKNIFSAPQKNDAPKRRYIETYQLIDVGDFSKGLNQKQAKKRTDREKNEIPKSFLVFHMGLLLQ